MYNSKEQSDEKNIYISFFIWFTGSKQIKKCIYQINSLQHLL
jgi:hypothetical protein